MAQLQKVSWRTAGYAALGTALAAASIVAIVNRDGVRPTSLTSNAATRWLVDQVSHEVVLVDGLAGHVVARIQTGADASDQVAVQGPGGAFLITPTQAAVRTISTAKLQLGTAQTVGTLAEPDVQYGVGESGLTIVNSTTNEAHVVAVDDVTREITIPKVPRADIAADGSMWFYSNTVATHVSVDASSTSTPLRSNPNQTTTIGSRAVSYDNNNQVVRWIGGGDVSVASIPNATEARLQEPGDDAPCVWLAAGDTLACVGPTGIDTRMTIDGMRVTSQDRLAVAGSAAVVVSDSNVVDRIDMVHGRLAPFDERPQVDPGQQLTITASGNLVWLDDRTGEHAWVVHRFGIRTIDKSDQSALLVNAQGQVQTNGDGGADPGPGNGDSSGGDEAQPLLDNNGVENAPVAVDDSVTARAGTTITVPVTGNDYDPDGEAIAVASVGDEPAGHGTTDVLSGTSVSYVPEAGYSGTDSFSYTITDAAGKTDTATVHIELFPPDSPNRPPIAHANTVQTRIDRPVIVDVLANDIDPERDLLSIATFSSSDNGALITAALGPTDLPALRYTPPPGAAGIFKFTYQAADPQGGTSEKTDVTVEVLGDDAENEKPTAKPDAIRLRVGTSDTLDVKANDTDPDGDDLTISVKIPPPPGIQASVQGGRLFIKMNPGADERSTLEYFLDDGIPQHRVLGQVLVVKIPESASNRPPVANPDADKVVVGNTVKIPVTANDVDPDKDKLLVVSVTQPANGAGTATVENNSVRFAPHLPDIDQPTPVSFTYTINDGHDHTATGTVTVTVLAEALPAAPFARDDFADTVTDKPVTIDVLANDTDPSGGSPNLFGDPVCPNGGEATITADQRITFAPPAGGVGTFRCRYQVGNAIGRTAQASIIVTVSRAQPGNQDPQINQALMNPEVPVGHVVSFDANVLATDPDGDSLVFSSVSKPTHGTTNFTQKSSTFTYTAPPSNTTDQVPDVDSIAVTISDGNAGNTPGTIAIRITPEPATSTPPSAPELQMLATVGQTPASRDVVDALRDANPGQTLTLKAVQPLSSPLAEVTLNGPVVVVTPKAPGSLDLTYTVSNGTQQSNGTIHVIIADQPPVNPPPVANDDALTVSSAGTGQVNLLANDTGIDPGDSPSVDVQNRPPASFGTVTIVNGLLTFTASRTSQGGTATLKYTLSDGTNVSAPADIVLTVLGCVDSPVSVHPGFLFTPYMKPINIDLSNYVDSGTIVAGSVVGAGLTGPTGTYTPPAQMNGVEQVTFTVTNACGDEAQGTLSIDVNQAPVAGTTAVTMARGSTQAFTADQIATDDEPLDITSIAGNPPWVSLVSNPTAIVASPPSNVASGTYQFTATVTDPGGLTAVATISLTIANQPPSANPDAYFTQLEDPQQFTFNPTTNDSDTEPGPLDIQTIAQIGGPTAVVVGINSPFVTVTLGHGVSTFSYTISDSGGLTDTSRVTITSNHPPDMADESASGAGASISFNLLPTDPDGDSVSVTCRDVPPDLSVVLTPNPNPSNPNEANRVNVTVTRSDGSNGGTFHCDGTDSFGAVATGTVTVTFID